MGRADPSIRAAALRDPNKIGGGYAAPAPQRPFGARGAAVLGDFLADSGDRDAAGELRATSVGLAHQICRIECFQGLSGLGMVAVARLASHGGAQGVEIGAKGLACRLIANLTLAELGAIEVGAGRARRADRRGPPAPPFGRRPKTMRVASGRPSPGEFCLSASTRFSCMTDRGGEPSSGRMGSGVWFASPRGKPSGGRLAQAKLNRENGVGGWQARDVRGERANRGKLRVIAAPVNGGGAMSRQPPYPGLAEASARSRELQMERRQEGLAWARAWRARNKPFFDALYGPDVRHAR